MFTVVGGLVFITCVEEDGILGERIHRRKNAGVLFSRFDKGTKIIDAKLLKGMLGISEVYTPTHVFGAYLAP